MSELSRTHQGQLSSLKTQVLGTDTSKPKKKWSRDLIQYRQRQLLLAKTQRYQEAHQTKLISDDLEERERSKMDSNTDGSLMRRERNLTKQHNAEMDALTKRINGMRRGYAKKRDEDCARLLQRNKSILATFDSNHVSMSCKCVIGSLPQNLKPINPSFNFPKLMDKLRQRNVRT